MYMSKTNKGSLNRIVHQTTALEMQQSVVISFLAFFFNKADAKICAMFPGAPSVIARTALPHNCNYTRP